MAQDAVDALGIDMRSRTAQLPLVGARPQPPAAQDPPRRDLPRRLIQRYGSEAERVAAYADDDPTLLDPVASDLPVLGVEVVHAVRAEGALDVDDVVERRTRLGLIPADADRARDRVSEIVEASR